MIKSKVVTCRKAHPCEWCGWSIQIGEMAYYRVSFEPDFCDGWMHVVCHNALERVPDVTGIRSFVFDPGGHPKGGINEDNIIDEMNA